LNNAFQAGKITVLTSASGKRATKRFTAQGVEGYPCAGEAQGADRRQARSFGSTGAGPDRCSAKDVLAACLRTL